MSMKFNHSGFTLIEMIMVSVIVGIMAMMALPRFFDNSVYQSRGFADQVQASLRYAQKVAIAQRRFVCVAFTSNSLTLTIGSTSACGTAFAMSNGAAALNAPTGIAFSTVPTNFYFNALGSPSLSQTISVNGAASSFTIEPETGYVH